MRAGRGVASAAPTRAAGSRGFGTLASHVAPRAWGPRPLADGDGWGKSARCRGRETTPSRTRAALLLLRRLVLLRFSGSGAC